MIWPRRSKAPEPTLHRGGLRAPTVVVLADAIGDAAVAGLVVSLGHLYQCGSLNFSVYTQADQEAGGPRCWANWLRQRRPAALVFARPGLPGDEAIVAFCHDRGIAVACCVDDAAPQRRVGPRFAEVRQWLPGACDFVIPGWNPGPDTASRAQELLQLLTVRASRGTGQRIAGFARLMPATLADVARIVLQRAWGPVQRDGDAARAPLRVLFVANSFLPTLQLCFTRPLQPLADADEIAWELLADIQLHPGGRVLSGGRGFWARRRIERFQPHVVVFCRYSGAHARLVTDWARRHGVPMIFHLDDDLLQVPKELGPEKYTFHNQPARLAAVRHLLDAADVLYCSTAPLLERMRQHGFRGRGLAAKVHCPGEVLRAPPEGDEMTIGYMGIDHAHDFRVALPALVRILDRNPRVRFEIFGPIATPPELERFGDRVRRIGFVTSYDGFLAKLASLRWAIGICPLADTPFNRFKANNKWVEYTAAGIATVATAGMLYDECCASGCGVLAGSDAEWERGLQALIDEPGRRREMVAVAQERLRHEYSAAVARRQLVELFRSALARAGSQLEAVAGARPLTWEGPSGD